jgi:hypothetical protein
MYLEWPNRIWATSLDLKFFSDFLELFAKMHLTITGVQISYNFWTYGSKVTEKQKKLRKVWARHACAEASIHYMCKKMWAGGRRKILAKGV